MEVEDLFGTVEVLLFPNDYERIQNRIREDAKLFIQGRVSVTEDAQAKLIAEKVTFFEDIPKEVWIQYPDKKAFLDDQSRLYSLLSDPEMQGRDRVTVFCRSERVIKRLPRGCDIRADGAQLGKLAKIYGTDNVKVTRQKLGSRR